jgi:hypothetical protein
LSTLHSTQTPALQIGVDALHAVPSTHCPPLQVCGVLLDIGLQRGTSMLGLQVQQTPPVQPTGQLVVDQCPLLSQTWLVLGSEHCWEGGTQSLQSLFVQAAHIFWVTQLPLALHVWYVVPTHCVAFGMQSTQPPPRHALGQTVPLLVHIPPSLQSCGCFSEHCLVVGMHGEHVPPTQNAVVPEHAVPLTHIPIALHVRGVLLLPQSLVLGTQEPVQAPMLHTLGQTEPLLAHLPVVSQSCGCVLLQRTAPGIHSQALVPTQVPVQTEPLDTHCALVLQLCGWLPLQREVPGVHSPPHEPALQR